MYKVASITQQNIACLQCAQYCHIQCDYIHTTKFQVLIKGVNIVYLESESQTQAMHTCNVTFDPSILTSIKPCSLFKYNVRVNEHALMKLLTYSNVKG